MHTKWKKGKEQTTTTTLYFTLSFYPDQKTGRGEEFFHSGFMAVLLRTLQLIIDLNLIERWTRTVAIPRYLCA